MHIFRLGLFVLMFTIQLNACTIDQYDNHGIEPVVVADTDGILFTSPNETDEPVSDDNQETPDESRNKQSITYPPDKLYGDQSLKNDQYAIVFSDILEMMRNDDFSSLSNFYDPDILIDERVEAVETKLDACSDCLGFVFEAPQGDYMVTPPVNWNADPYSDVTWRFYFHSLRWLQHTLAAKESGDAAALRTAFAIIGDWMDSNLFCPDNAEYDWSNHEHLYRTEILISAYHAYMRHDFKDNQFRNRLLLAIALHAYMTASNLQYGFNNNHGIMADLLLMRLIDIMPHLKITHSLYGHGKQRGAVQFKGAFTDEGVHKEHTPCYHDLVVALLNRYINELVAHDDEDASAWLPLLQNTMKFLAYVIQPNGLMPGIGDCIPNTEVFLGDDVIREHQSLLYSHSLGEAGMPPDDTLAVFEDSGWAIFRSNWEVPFSEHIYAAIQADFFSTVHYQRDDTSFIIYFKDTPLIVDPGYHSYNYAEIPVYARSAMAHNVVIADETNFDLDINNIGSSGITRWAQGADDSWVGIVELTHPHYEKYGIGSSRRFAYLGDTAFYVHDILQSAETHQYTQQFQLAENAECETTEAGTVKCTWSSHSNVLWFKTNREVEVEIVEGQSAPPMGWYFPKFSQAVPSPVLRFTVTDRSAYQFHTTISVKQDDTIPNWAAMELLASVAESYL